MALTSELLRPFSLVKLACWFGIRTAIIIISTWVELTVDTINLHVNTVLRIISWTFGLIFLPARLLNVFQREKQLEHKLQEMQNEVGNLLWHQKELQERVQVAVKERKMMELLLSELEEEHDMAIAKIEKLEEKLRDQINENLRLKEIQGKGYWSFKDKNNTDSGQNTDESNYIPSLKSNNSEHGMALQNLLMHKSIYEEESKTRTELLQLLKTEAVKPVTGSKDVVVQVSEVVDHQRDVALSQSLFSAIMSLVVGVTVWEAKDPCMPLVVALFTVVGMSLKSVVQFFSTIKNKPASDAVALLSFNWFILGTLSYPTLPRIARVLAPFLLRLLDQTILA